MVARGIVEVDAAPAVVGVDLAGQSLLGVGPVNHAVPPDALHDRVERFVVDEERVVVAGEVNAGFREVQQPPVTQPDLDEEPRLGGIIQPEDTGEELRRGALVTRGDDRVIEPDIRSVLAHVLVLTSFHAPRQGSERRCGGPRARAGVTRAPG